MTGQKLLSTVILIAMLVTTAQLACGQTDAPLQWHPPFPDTAASTSLQSDSLSLDQVLLQVAKSNATLTANRWRNLRFEELIRQARLRPNPELSFDAEQVAGNYPGFSQSELTVQASQTLELGGKRSAREKVAQTDFAIAELEGKLTAFEIFADTKERFFALLYAQHKVILKQQSHQLVTELAEAARFRVEQGAALVSEQLLGELTVKRAWLGVTTVRTELANARRDLIALWNGSLSDSIAVSDEFETPPTLPTVNHVRELARGNAESVRLRKELERSSTQLRLEQSNAKPDLSLSGGFKRLQGDRTNTLLFGVSLPLPLFNRNQGAVASLQAQQREQEALTVSSDIAAVAEAEQILTTLNQLVANHRTVEDVILPEYERVFASLKNAYSSGRLSYPDLLEGERNLNDTRFQLNDLKLDIQLEVIALERLVGLPWNDIVKNVKE
ncbi:MAG TPA: TolC family protein [Candidatus Deferrimicrobium sp.]|nr:TolC family protein [Candidatus Deferrimicrobium sp.]